jgi:hypothetical protein
MSEWTVMLQYITLLECSGQGMSQIWEHNVHHQSTLSKTCPSAILSTTNPTWTGLGLNSGLSSDRLATICLSHSPHLNICRFLMLNIHYYGYFGCYNKYYAVIQYSLLGRTAASTHLNTTFRGLAPSPSSGKTDLTYSSSVPCFSTCCGRKNQTGS